MCWVNGFPQFGVLGAGGGGWLRKLGSGILRVNGFPKRRVRDAADEDPAGVDHADG